MDNPKEKRKHITMNEAQLKQIYELHFNSLCTFLNYYTHNRFIIEDTIQDIFVKLWEDRNNVDIFFIKSYLYQAARNKILNHIRNEKNRNNLIENIVKQEIDKQYEKDCVDKEEFFRFYEAAINTLPEKCKEIFRLSHTKNLSNKEIAKIKQISINTVETQISIANKKIKHFIIDKYNKNNNLLLIILFILNILKK